MTEQAVLRPEFLKLLVCPESRQPLQLAEESLVKALNAAIAAGGVQTVAGDALTEPVEAALVREDGQVLYTINGRIPRLTKEEGVVVEQFSAGG